jgi:predicted PhzF superfamily epimerase YddE/YHI9
LDFPAQEVKTVSAPAELVHALGFAPHGDPIAAYRAEDDWLLSVPRKRIESLRPNFPLLRDVSQWLKLRGLIVTAKAGPEDEYDFISRFFAPAVGVDEDPVTGSAHTKLGPFWGKLLKKQVLKGYQASARGGLVGVKWQDERVILQGKAQTTVRGQLLF